MSEKDNKGAYLPPVVTKVWDQHADISIDDTIRDCLVCVRRIVDKISADTTRNVMPPRETVMTLRDCLSMLMEAKKKESEILDGMDTEALKKIVQGD